MSISIGAIQNVSFGTKYPQVKKPENKSNSIQPNNDTKSSSGHAMRNATMAVLLPVSLLTAMTTASCNKDDDYDFKKLEVIANAEANASATATDTIRGGAKDTVYVWDRGIDTVYVDTGSYHVQHDTIVKWKDNFQRPFPLDSIMKNLHNWDIDESIDPDKADSTDNRNIIHYEAIREWEENAKTVADVNLAEGAGNPRILVYDTKFFDYLDNPIGYGKEVYRVPADNERFTVVTKDGQSIKSPKGFFVTLYSRPSETASIWESVREDEVFCQTVGDSLKVYKRNPQGQYVEAGKAAQGYLEKNSVLLRDLIGMYSTDDHLVDVKFAAVNDDVLRNLYLRQRDEEVAATEGK